MSMSSGSTPALRHVDVLRAGAGHLEGRVRGARGLGPRKAGAQRQLVRCLPMTESKHRNRLGYAQSPCPFSAHHHQGPATVGHQRTVVAPQGIDDPGRGEVIVHGQGLAQLRVRIARAVAAAGQRDRAKSLGGRAMLDHVAAVDHRVAGCRGKPAHHGVVAPGAGVNRPVAGARVVGVSNQRDVALIGLDGHDGHRQQRDVGRPALVPGASQPRLDAQGLGHLLAEHELMRRGGHLDQHRIDDGFLEARVGKRFAAGFDIQ